MTSAVQWRASSPDGFERDLTALWREAAHDGPVSRALMSNLLIVRPDGRGEGALERWDTAFVAEVVRRHPARVVMLDYAPGAPVACGPERTHVGVLTFGAASSRYGIELIAIRANCAEASIPSIARRLKVGGVPTTVWWQADLSATPPPASIIELGRQLVYDSAGWRHLDDGFRRATALLASANPPDLVDVNWRRLAPLRRGIALAAATVEAAVAPEPGEVSIRCRPGDAPLAALLEGWLRHRLGWPSLARIRTAPCDLADDDRLELELPLGRTRPVARLSRQQVTVRIDDAPPHVLAVPDESEPQAIADELGTLAPNTGLVGAIRSFAASLEHR